MAEMRSDPRSREFAKMKHEAEQNMQELHRSAKPQPEQKPSAGKTADPEPSAKEPEKKQPEGFLSALMKDSDRTIILALLLLMMDEGGDHSLILALMYLLL